MDLNEINWNQLQKDLEKSFEGTFKKMWIQHTRLRSVCITAFPEDTSKHYRIFTEKNVNDFNVNSLREIVLSQI